MRIILSILLVYVVSVNSAIAQTQEVKQYSSWNTLNIKNEINANWYVNAELDFRRTQFQSKWEQIILRPTLHYKFEKDIDVAFGYSYVRNFHHSKYSVPLDATEHNIFQEITLKHKFSKFSFNHRLRWEERFINEITKNDNGIYAVSGTKSSNRFRYKFQIEIPIHTFKSGQKLGFVTYDEAFLIFKKLRPTSLNQNWMFFGLTYQLNKHISLKSGYHDVYAKKTKNLFINEQIWETSITYKI